ncbi:MAG TPA: hypothetical protein VLL07_04370, partial [Pontiella sp.]|nr:hypothetical protein [Pontiella sp.]
IRDYAVIALESIGEPCASTAATLALARAKPEAKAWFQQRSEWSGAPSWRIDLWGAVAALNPQFEQDQSLVTRLKNGGSAGAAIVTRKDFEATRPTIPLLINLLDDSACARGAEAKLTAAGTRAAFPLIAAIEDKNAAIAEGAAAILASQKDQRAYGPLMNVLQRRIDAGELLSDSSVYAALIKLNRPEADPLLLKIRPSAARAIQVFERQYEDVRVIAANSMDAQTDHEAPIVFHLAYEENGVQGKFDLTFKKDSRGEWHPSPALPYSLQQPESKSP